MYFVLSLEEKVYHKSAQLLADTCCVSVVSSLVA